MKKVILNAIVHNMKVYLTQNSWSNPFLLLYTRAITA